MFTVFGQLSMRPVTLFRCLAWAATALLSAGTGFGNVAGLEHFEKRVRPLLAENCYACHSAEAPSVFADLRLDSRAGVLRGGDSGPAVVPGDPGGSFCCVLCAARRMR